MNEEEKKAIETLKRIDIEFFLSGSIEQSNYIVDRADEINKYIEILLNLIEKQAKEIEELKSDNYELNNRIKEQEKVIDVLAEKLEEKSMWKTREAWKVFAYKEVEVKENKE